MVVMLRTINFQGYELKCKCGCGRLNYDNLFLMKLETFRDILGSPLEVTSGGRCKAHNATVGGVETSLHICEGHTAKAADVSPYRVECEEVYNLAVKLGIFNEVIWHKLRTFIHLGCDPTQKEPYYDIKED